MASRSVYRRKEANPSPTNHRPSPRIVKVNQTCSSSAVKAAWRAQLEQTRSLPAAVAGARPGIKKAPETVRSTVWQGRDNCSSVVRKGAQPRVANPDNLCRTVEKCPRHGAIWLDGPRCARHPRMLALKRPEGHTDQGTDRQNIRAGALIYQSLLDFSRTAELSREQ